MAPGIGVVLESSQMTGRDGGETPVRVVIVSRRSDVRRGLEIRLALECDMAVVGSAASVETALHRLRGLQPEVLLVDLDAGPELSERAVGLARAAVAGLRVVLLTHHPEAWPGSRLAGFGADEVVNKEPAAGELIASIRRCGDPTQGFV